MIFIRLFAWRSIKYFATLSVVLTIIVTLVQFFERMISARQATLQELIYFLGIDALPTWISLFPVTIWLTTICLLREWQLRGEWDLMMMININPMRVLRLFCALGCITSIFTIFFQECGMLQLAHLSKKFKHEKIKKNTQAIITNKHLALDSQRFATIGSYDKISQTGNQLSLFDITPSFSSFQRVTHHEHFSLHNQSLTETLRLQLDTDKRIPSLYDYTTNNRLLPPDEYTEYHDQLSRYIMTIFDLIFLAPLCFLLFITWHSFDTKQWTFILGLYPFLFLLKAFSIGISHVTHQSLMFLPYALLIVLFYASIKAFHKKLLLKKI